MQHSYGYATFLVVHYIDTHAGPMPIKEQTAAVFFDRDGTLIEQIDNLHTQEELRLYPDVASVTRAIHESEYLVIMVTNQPVVARGIITPQEVEGIHDTLAGLIRAQGGHLDAVYYCPHHPNANVENYRTVCTCRKPAPGMLQRAAREHNLDLSQSFIVGDSTQDIQAGIRAGVHTILVQTGHAGKDPWQHEGTPDHTVSRLSEILPIITQSKCSTP